MPLPLLLVFAEDPPAGLERALEAEGLLHRRANARDAAASVNDGWAEVVLCGRVPAWQALVARVEAANGAAVLWGAPPDPSELRGLSSPPPSADTPAAAVREVRAALERLVRDRAVSADEWRERLHTAERVNRFAQSIALQLDLSQAVDETVARTRDLCDADGASLSWIDPASGELTCSASIIDGGQGVAAQVARTAQPALVARAAPAQQNAAGTFTTGSVIAAPLVLAGDLVGVLEAVRGADRPPFTDVHLRRLVELAPHVAVAVHNAQITARLKEAQAQVEAHNQELERRIEARTLQIARAKREWEATFDAIAEPISVQDGFTIRRANVAYAKWAGVPVKSVPGKKCYELLCGRDSPCEACPLVSGRGDSRGEIHARGDRVLRYSLFQLPDGGGVVLHYMDVTAQRALERRLRESERLASLGQLASGAAHEINNPLGFLVSNLRSLNGRLDEIEERVDPEWVEDCRDMIQESLSGGARVAEIVRGLRELSRQQLPTAGTADVNAAVSRTVNAELAGCEQILSLELEPLPKVAVDPLQLDQALGQVLRNARQAVSGGQRICVRTRAEGGEVLVEVEDEGVGISPEHLGRVFEPFFTTRGVGKGLGLGLTATWGIVERHGGRIEVASTPGRGARFTLRLPRAVTPEQAAHPLPA